MFGSSFPITIDVTGNSYYADKQSYDFGKPRMSFNVNVDNNINIKINKSAISVGFWANHLVR